MICGDLYLDNDIALCRKKVKKNYFERMKEIFKKYKKQEKS